MLIYTEITPNPQSLKFVLPPEVVAIERGNRTYEQAELSEAWPAGIQALFQIPGVESVFLTRAFVTITKSPEVGWHELIPAVKEVLKTYLAQGPLAPEGEVSVSESSPEGIERQIVEAIEEYIRPAIAMDGGDVEYVGYSDGVVKLRLMGSCVGCPSSIVTLKAGIENLLSRLIPEVKAVEAV
jgi:Fe-S cluster biogenesis protein NfuA